MWNKLIVYTICNPVEAGLVASPEAWPGLTTRLSDLDVSESGQVYRRTFKKPEFFFRCEEDGGELPDEATLYISPHPLGQADPKRFVAEVKERVRKRIARKQAEVRKAGGTFAGRKAVLAKDWRTEPKTWLERRCLNPRFAEPDPDTRIGILSDYKAFIAEYQEARALWLLTGSAVFPAGTYQLRNYPGVRVRGRPSAAMRG